MPWSQRTPRRPRPTSEPPRSHEPAWRIGALTLAIAFVGSQLLDFVNAQGLAATEPRGYFAEVNPLLALISDPVARQLVGFALKVAVVTFVFWVARLRRRRAISTALLAVGTLAGLFGTWSNVNSWR